MAFLPGIFFLGFVYGLASLPGCKKHMKVLAWIFFTQYGCRIKTAEIKAKFHKCWLRIALICTKISEKFFQKSFFLKFLVRISIEFGTKRDKFQFKRMSIHPRKKSNSFTHKRKFLSALAVINKNIYCKSCGTNLSWNLSKNSIDTVLNVW